MSAATLRERIIEEYGRVSNAGRTYRTAYPWGDNSDPAQWSATYTDPKAMAECIANAVLPEIATSPVLIIKQRFDPTSGLPSSPAEGDIYLATATANGWTKDHLYTRSGTTYTDTAPAMGMEIGVSSPKGASLYLGTEWFDLGATSGSIAWSQITGAPDFPNLYAPKTHGVTDGYMPAANGTQAWQNTVLRRDDATSVTVTLDNKLKFRDANIFINSPSAGNLDISAFAPTGSSTISYKAGAAADINNAGRVGFHDFYVGTGDCGGTLMHALSIYGGDNSSSYATVFIKNLLRINIVPGKILKTTTDSYVTGAVAGTDYEAPISQGTSNQVYTYNKTWQRITSDWLTEGSSNLFYTTSRAAAAARAALSANGPVTYNSSTGAFGWDSSNISIGVLSAGKFTVSRSTDNDLATFENTTANDYSGGTPSGTITLSSKTVDGYQNAPVRLGWGTKNSSGNYKPRFCIDMNVNTSATWSNSLEVTWDSFGSPLVGIGKSPSYALDVNGVIRNNNDIRGNNLYAENGTTRGTYIGCFKGQGNLPGYPNDHYPVLKTDFTDLYIAVGGKYVGSFYSSSTVNGLSMMDTSPSEKIVLSTNGNSFFKGGKVGIGTSSPTYKLHTQSTGSEANNWICVEHSATDKYAGFYAQSASGNQWVELLALGSATSDAYCGVTKSSALLLGGDYAGVVTSYYNVPLIFGTNNTERMRINATNGRVGIGITNPAYALDVAGDIQATADIFGGRVYAWNSTARGNYFGCFKRQGDLPGYASDYYPVLKTDNVDMYFSTGGKYSAYLGGSDCYFGMNNSSAVEKVYFNTNGNSYFNGGNLAIGTNGNSSWKLYVSDSTVGSSYNSMLVLTNGTDNDLQFTINRVGASNKYSEIKSYDTNPLLLNSTTGGYVGIGKTLVFKERQTETVTDGATVSPTKTRLELYSTGIVAVNLGTTGVVEGQVCIVTRTNDSSYISVNGVDINSKSALFVYTYDKGWQ
jgi:hypothetical protein